MVACPLIRARQTGLTIYSRASFCLVLPTKGMGDHCVSFLIQWLDLLNRKERFFLLQDALGKRELGRGFRRKLGDKIAQRIPAEACWWTDYHFDWVLVALHLTQENPEDNDKLQTVVHESPDFAQEGEPSPVYVNTNQEDIDLLVAFSAEDRVHLV